MTTKNKKYHIAIPQLYSDYVRTLCRPENGYLRRTTNSFTDISFAYYRDEGICKICKKIASAINARTWNEAHRDVQIESKKQFEIRMKMQSTTYLNTIVNVYTPMTWIDLNIV